MKKLALMLAVLGFATSPVSAATPPAKPKSAQCRDAHGKFIKCPDKAAPKKTQCRDAKGKFVKC